MNGCVEIQGWAQIMTYSFGMKPLTTQLFYIFGAHQTIIELLRELFPDGENKPPRLTDKAAQAWMLNALANSYALSGQSKRAISLYVRDIKILGSVP